MNRKIKILNFKTLVVTLGILIASAIIAEPILKQHLSSAISVAQPTELDDSKDTQNSDTVVSEFQAVTPAVQFDFNSQKYVLEEVKLEFQKIEVQILTSIKKTSNKLFSILFRLIIGPNAP